MEFNQAEAHLLLYHLQLPGLLKVRFAQVKFVGEYSELDDELDDESLGLYGINYKP